MLTEPMLAEGGLHTRRASCRVPVSWIGKRGVKLGFKRASLLGVERGLNREMSSPVTVASESELQSQQVGARGHRNLGGQTSDIALKCFPEGT